MPILRFRLLRLYLQFRSGIFLARFSAGQRVTVGITHSRTPLIGMAAAGRTGALIFERPGLGRVFTLVVRTSAAVIEPRRIIVGQREANRGGAFGHILQFKIGFATRLGYPVVQLGMSPQLKVKEKSSACALGASVAEPAMSNALANRRVFMDLILSSYKIRLDVGAQLYEAILILLRTQTSIRLQKIWIYRVRIRL